MPEEIPPRGGRDQKPPGPPESLRTRGSTSHPLPSGEYPLEIHFDVLRRFMGASRNGIQPVEPTAVEGPGLPSGAATSNAPFLADIGLLIEERPGHFKPTPVAMQFINTQMADDARGRRLLRSLIERTWFGQTIRTLYGRGDAGSVRLEDLVPVLETSAHTTAGQDETAFRLLVDYLVYTGIVPRREEEVPRTGGAPISSGANSPKPSRSTAVPALGAEPEARSRSGASSSSSKGPWELIQTSEFSLTIRPKLTAVKRLKKELEHLERRLNEDVGQGADQ